MCDSPFPVAHPDKGCCAWSLQIGAVNEATEDVFAYGSDVRVLDPAAGKGAEAAQQEAAEAAQVGGFPPSSRGG